MIFVFLRKKTFFSFFFFFHFASEQLRNNCSLYRITVRSKRLWELSTQRSTLKAPFSASTLSLSRSLSPLIGLLFSPTIEKSILPRLWVFLIGESVNIVVYFCEKCKIGRWLFHTFPLLPWQQRVRGDVLSRFWVFVFGKVGQALVSFSSFSPLSRLLELDSPDNFRENRCVIFMTRHDTTVRLFFLNLS